MSYLLAIVLLATLASAKPITHTILFSVERVIDGDTTDGVAYIWPEIDLHTLVRVRGIDTPEKRGGCPESRVKGVQATAFTDSLVHAAQRVWLTSPELGKYAGRIIADVWVDSTLLAPILIQRALAKPYEGRGARPDWCQERY